MRKLLPLWCPTLYRTLAACAIAALLCAPAAAQRAQKQPSGPRAVAVLEEHTTSAGTKVYRLVPVAILLEGRFHDASLFRARPEPMALDQGVVYEVLRTGMPAGLFTLHDARRDESAWFGLGSYEPPAKPEEAAPAPKPTGPIVVPGAKSDEDDERPTMRRKDGTENDSPNPEQKPGEQKSAPAAPAPKQDADPDRPVMRRPAEPEKAPSPPLSEDPNRPVLRRGRPEPQEQQETKAEDFAKMAQATQRMVAVSDAGNNETRPYAFEWTEAERTRLTAALEKMAAEEAVASIGAPEAPKPARGKRATAKPAAFKPTTSAVRAFDLDTDNVPELIYQASFTNGGRTADIFLIARTDIEGNLRRLFRHVAPSSRLDVAPRLELVDAVDADGDGRGEIVVRASGTGSAHYRLYKVGRTVEMLMESAVPAR